MLPILQSITETFHALDSRHKRKQKSLVTRRTGTDFIPNAFTIYVVVSEQTTKRGFLN